MERNEHSYENLLQQLELKKSTLPPDNEEIADDLLDIAQYLFSIQNFDEALDKCQQAHEIYKKKLEFDHPSIQASLLLIMTIYVEQGKFDKALEHSKEILKIRQKILQPDHPDLADILFRMGQFNLYLGNIDSSLECLFKAIEIQRKQPKTNIKQAEMYRFVGEAYSKKQKYSQALEYYEKALHIFKHALPENHQTLHDIKDAIGGVEEAKKKETSSSRICDIL